MTKKEYCINNKPIAYYSGLNGIKIHGIEYGIDDYIYCSSGHLGGTISYHKAKVYYMDEKIFFKLYGNKIPLDECMRF